jgi:fucose 4-O-acetylase-like acetyltransferase
MVETTMPGNDRIYLYDNIKAILITLMVFGHFMILNLRDSGGELYQMLWMGIYSFHMPAFFFISGLLESKRAKSGSRSTVNLFIYYLLMCVFVFWVRSSSGIHFDFSFVFPPFAVWFLLVLAVYKLFLPVVKDMKHVVVLALAITLASGLFDDLGTFMSMQRVAAFSVFFFAGYSMSKDVIQKLRAHNLVTRAAVAVVCFGMIAIVAFYLSQKNVPLDIFFNKLPYNTYFDNQYIGLAARGLFVLTSAVGILGLLMVVPQKKTLFSYVGENSVSIYFFHTVVFYLLLRHNLSFIAQNGLLLLFVTIVYVLVAGAKPFAYILNQIVNVISKPFFPQKGA